MAQSRINEVLKALRIEKSLSQKQLAEILNVAQNTVSNWENGTREPDLPTITRLAEIFKVSTDYLIGKTAFKNGFELFEHWGYSVEGFEAPFDFGELLKREREAQSISQEEVSVALNITSSDVEDIENGILPLNYDWAEKYAKFLGTSVAQIFFDNEMYDEETHPEFNGDLDRDIAFKKAVDKDALSEGAPYGSLPPDEITEILETLHKRPEMQALFSTTKNATKEDIEKAMKIIEALKDE